MSPASWLDVIGTAIISGSILTVCISWPRLTRRSEWLRRLSR